MKQERIIVADSLEIVSPKTVFSVTYGAELPPKITSSNITTFGSHRGVPPQYKTNIPQNDTDFKETLQK